MKKYEYIIVGSGAGGSTLAMELSLKGKNVLIVESGTYESEIGTMLTCGKQLGFDTELGSFPVSKEGVVMLRANMLGGTTVLSCGNTKRSMEYEFSSFGINLENEFIEAERQMKVQPIDDSLLSEGSRAIRKATNDLGYQMKNMPKCIISERCSKCALCVTGCKQNAKWTALDFLDIAKSHGAQIMVDTKVQKVLVEQGKATGIKAIKADREIELKADAVILSAGAMATPLILQNTGIKEAGNNLSGDIFEIVYGYSNHFNQIHEPVMGMTLEDFHQDYGFLLSPYINIDSFGRKLEGGINSPNIPPNNLVGIIIKTADSPSGTIYPDGSVSKTVPTSDQNILNKGIEVASEILLKAGVQKESIEVTKPAFAHPAGTAAMGQIVDKHFQTKIDNLFVCDASVFPITQDHKRVPLPMLTIVALAKRLAKELAP